MAEAIYHAFTFNYHGITGQLRTPVTIINGEKIARGDAIWDTGATNTCISQSIVDTLKLVPTGKNTMLTPQGRTEVDTYLVDIVLPNNVKVEGVRVCGSSIDNQGLSVLIGMDIITTGDMSVSNFNRMTVFTFRLPSKTKTDYVQEINIENLTGPKHGKGKRKR